MSKLLKALAKKGSTENSVSLDSSTFFSAESTTTTPIHVLNLALSGDLDGGLQPGLTTIAGRSKSFKTTLSLVTISSYMKKHPEAICLFYDTEFGASKEYFESAGIDSSRVLHIPVLNVEELKFDLVAKLEEITLDDNVIIFVDSIGNVSSKKEIDDAKDMKAVADMTRAKAIKSLFRIVTPYLTLKQIPMIVINHVYSTMSMYGGDEMSGGCLLEGTKVLMADETTKEIQDIKIGEYLKTLLGDRMVTNTWNPSTLEEGNPECLSITLEDGSNIKCSKNHKFLINGFWIEAKDLSVGEHLETLD